MPAKLAHQRLLQETKYVTMQENRRQATLLEKELRDKSKSLADDGFIELASIVRGFQSCIGDYRTAIGF